jgi:hypothetical protein
MKANWTGLKIVSNPAPEASQSAKVAAVAALHEAMIYLAEYFTHGESEEVLSLREREAKALAERPKREAKLLAKAQKEYAERCDSRSNFIFKKFR